MGWRELGKPDRSRWVGNVYSMEWMNASLSLYLVAILILWRLGLVSLQTPSRKYL
jgi:hypothetical protein